MQKGIATIKTDIGEIKLTLNEMNMSEQKGIDATSVGIVLVVVIIIVVVTGVALFLRKRQKSLT